MVCIRKNQIKQIALAIVGLIFIRLLVAPSFVDIPYRDSWQIIVPQLAEFFPFRWFVQAHNEHIIFLTKLQVWLLYKVNSWNVVSHLWLNAFIYLSAVLILFSTDKKNFILLSGIFLFCNLNWENLSWEFQSCFHFFILFMILTAKSIESGKNLQATVFNFLMLLSFSAAAGASLAFAIPQFRANKKLALSLIFPCIVYVFRTSNAKLVLPYQLEFWDFFLNSISFGFGFETYSWILGLFCVFMILFPLLRNYQSNDFASNLALASFASLAVVAVGRAGNTDLHIWAKGSRYFEISSLLIPSGYLLWNNLLARSSNKSNFYSLFFLLLPLIGTLDNWDYSIYSWIGEQKVLGKECMISSKQKEIFCRTLWAGESSGKVKISRELGLSYIRGDSSSTQF